MAQISDLLRVFEGAINRGLIMATHDTGPKEINKKKTKRRNGEPMTNSLGKCIEMMASNFGWTR